jgi:hypothetical protein
VGAVWGLAMDMGRDKAIIYIDVDDKIAVRKWVRNRCWGWGVGRRGLWEGRQITGLRFITVLLKMQLKMMLRIEGNTLSFLLLGIFALWVITLGAVFLRTQLRSRELSLLIGSQNTTNELKEGRNCTGL